VFSPQAVQSSSSPTAVLVRLQALTLLLIVTVGAAGCAAVGGIFKAGLWVGLITAILVVAVVFFLVRRLSR
jgi:type III secretory pathway component EscU